MAHFLISIEEYVQIDVARAFVNDFLASHLTLNGLELIE